MTSLPVDDPSHKTDTTSHKENDVGHKTDHTSQKVNDSSHQTKTIHTTGLTGEDYQGFGGLLQVRHFLFLFYNKLYYMILYLVLGSVFENDVKTSFWFENEIVDVVSSYRFQQRNETK